MTTTIQIPTSVSTPKAFEWSVVRDRRALAEIVHDWTWLHRDSGTPNPFSHPAWVTTWLDRYARPDDLYVVPAG